MTEIANNINAIRARAEERAEKTWHLKEEIISKLGLETKPEYVSDNQPLFGRGLEMDSLDTLEVVVTVNNEFGVSVNDDDTKAFGSINAMVDFIEENQK
ncbi:acyl carrier protein [Cutibacterium sp. WCA-380-WT-3A]|uniref:Acyl carrier protein n=1 Tax=Cutibacterium porci TaxID=2605781 RepID=A0A7K0J3W9_9ACTN|nr:phosphopantetheine-binding protein [Cutibacterium porci]MSS44614.1 acyl carrier protein [Cutibacterium porci]